MIAAALLFAVAAFAADDGCDIALRPAATLLLPYFEVDLKSPQGSATQTLFTIQNTSRLPQIAHVTLWTDWGFAALDFNIFLPGYDVQGINLYDILVHATIVSTSGMSSNASVPSNPTAGSQPARNNENPKISITFCSSLPGTFPKPLLQDLQQIFTIGRSAGNAIPCPAQIGGAHTNAIGYATIDVMSSCNTSLPSQPQYWDQILYDNVLTGDYQQITPLGGRLAAHGGPLVHIRAVAEGTTLPHTFYEQWAPKMSDRRQPLPSVFAPRYVSGGPSGFRTRVTLWREATPPASRCSDYSANSTIPFVDVVRFDEHENAAVPSGCIIVCPTVVGTPATISVPAESALFPVASTSGDVGGWLYLNLGSQGWVISSMLAEQIDPVDVAAPALVDGCTPAPKPGAQVGPSP